VKESEGRDGEPAAARHDGAIVISRPLNTCQQEKWTRAAAGAPAAARHAATIASHSQLDVSQ
jgi:hypothetical protein